jgi:3-phenylpropionate/cinnamic acid dioxygenase small subunit
MNVEDRLAVHELLALHGHLVDAGEFDRLGELLTDDAEYAGIRGFAELEAASRRLGDGNPVAHHVTNIVVTEDPDGTVRARSKGLGVYADGRAGSVVYDDVLRRTPDGWRIARRVITARRTPLTP